MLYFLFFFSAFSSSSFLFVGRGSKLDEPCNLNNNKNKKMLLIVKSFRCIDRKSVV